jgi:TRAP-type C4-dicarboxylate transport system substrate-binding protein
MKRILSIVCLLVLVLTIVVSCAPETAPPAEVIEWRIHTPHNEARLPCQRLMAWADTVSQASGGRLKVTVYPSSSLGYVDADMLRVLQAGTIEGALGVPTYLSRDYPGIAMLQPHGVMQSRDQFAAVYDPLRKMFKEGYAEWDITVVAGWPYNACGVYLIANKPISSFAEWKGLKTRAFAADQAESLRRMGIPAEVFPQADTYLSIKTGVIDTSLHSADGIVSLNLNEVCDYVVEAYPYPPYIMMVTISNVALNALPADLRDIVLETSAEWDQKMRGLMMDCSADTEMLDVLKERGMTVLDPFPPEETAKYHDVAAALWEEEAQKLGGKTLANVQELIALLG